MHLLFWKAFQKGIMGYDTFNNHIIKGEQGIIV